MACLVGMAGRVLDVTDPVALRALAHRLRLRRLRLGRELGPVTGPGSPSR